MIERALNHPFGLAVECDEGRVEAFRQKIYAYLRRIPSPVKLSLVVSPMRPNEELWLIHTWPQKEESDGN